MIFIFLKTKSGSPSICRYERLKLWHSCEIYLTVHDGNHELHIFDRVPNEKKLIWSVTVPEIFQVKTL